MNDRSPLSLSNFLYSSFSRTYQLLERHNTLLISPMCYSLDQKLTVGLEVGWGFVFLASCSSLSQEKGIIPWTLLFPRYYVLTNFRINEEVTYMCPALQLHLGPPESQASKAREGASRFQLLVTISLKSFSWSPRRHRTDTNCSIGRSLRLFPAELMCTTLFYATIS